MNTYMLNIYYDNCQQIHEYAFNCGANGKISLNTLRALLYQELQRLGVRRPKITDAHLIVFTAISFDCWDFDLSGLKLGDKVLFDHSGLWVNGELVSTQVGYNKEDWEDCNQSFEFTVSDKILSYSYMDEM